MNITVSIEDHLFQQAHHAAKVMNKTVEQLIGEYLRHFGRDEIFTERAEFHRLPEKRTFSQKWRGYFRNTCADARFDYLKERYKL
jgi:hypothetical protein